MKKRYVQKMLTMVLTAAMICSSVPVAAETVSENETAVTVDTAAKQETAEKPELEADEEAQPEEAGETVEEADAADIEADMLETEDTEVENGKEGYLSYRIYQKPDETKYVEITECDYDAKGAVEIPTKIKNIAVTSIGNGAFNERTKLTNIEIPSSVTSIGERAFMGCSGLTGIEIPSSVTSIGEKAFMGCSGLTGIKIPAGVTSIGSSAFYGCSRLTSIEIPAGVTSIGYGAFYGCSGLTSINVEAGNVSYDSRDNCNAIIEKATNTLIQGCNNTKIPSGVTKIGSFAFDGCSGLTSIEIPVGVTEIGSFAFDDCSGLTGIKIPSSVTSIGNSAFYGCSGLTSIVVEADNTVYDSRDDCNAIIKKETNTLIHGCKNTKIPSSVTRIGERAFWDCSELTSIEIPSSVTRIGYGAFDGCSGLTSITVEAGNAMYDSRDNSNALIETKTNTLILGCKSTKIPSSVTSIGSAAFQFCEGLTSITIPEGVTSIGESAFEGCSGLTSIEIPSSVTSIGNYAFRDCIGLKDVYYTGTQEQWDNIWGSGNDASDVFYYYDEDLDENISIPFTLHCNSSESAPSASPSPKPSEQPSVAPSATPSEKPSAAPSAAPSVTPSEQPSAKPSAAPSKTPEANVPAAGTTLKEKTGREYKVTKSDSSKGKPSVTLTKLSAKEKKAKKVTIPKTVTVDNVEYQVTGIAAKAFKNSKKLQSIVIPDTITEIGASSFEGCKNLKSVTIGKNVTSIGKNAFKNCKNLKKITVKSTKLKKVGKGALTGINRKCVIKVPKKKLKSYKSLFKGKGQKKSVKIK